MKRVKYFWTTNGGEELSKAINEWLDNNPEINPIHVSFSRTAERYGAMLLYEEIKKI